MTRLRIFSIILISALTLMSCATPLAPLDRNAFNTAVAQTVSAGLTQNYVTPTFTLTPSITPTFTITPTATNTPPDSPTPTISLTPTITFTPDIPLPDLSVSVNTNCRSGPGKDFPVQGSLLVGETVKIYGVDPTGQYWYINNPDPGQEFCWLAGTFATPDSSTSFVPVFTPPPTFTATPTATPVPDFRITFSKIDGCGDWVVEVTLYNAGKVAFKSGFFKLKEAYSGANPSKFTNGFINVNKCDGKEVVDTLAPGYSVTVSGPPLKTDPTGRKITFTATLCTELDGKGECYTRTATFKP